MEVNVFLSKVMLKAIGYFYNQFPIFCFDISAKFQVPNSIKTQFVNIFGFFK